MPGIPKPILRSLHTALTAILDEGALQTLSVLLFGTGQAFRSKVRNDAFDNQVTEYLTVLDREGNLLTFIKKFLEDQQANQRQEITSLRAVVDKMIILTDGGKTGLTPGLFNVVKLGSASPFIARKSFQNHLRKVLNREEFVRNIITLGGGARSGHSYLGEYLAELSDRYDLFTTIKIDFQKDVPKDANGSISAVRVAHKLAVNIPGLEHYRNMFQDRPADFKLSTFQDDLIASLKNSDQLHLFFFDHLNKVAINDELQDLIIHLADRVARPGVKGMVIFSGLLLRPTDNIFGDPRSINLQPVNRDQVKTFLSAFYKLTSGTKSAKKQADGIAFLKMALNEIFPPSLFTDDPPCSISEIGELLSDVIESYLEATEEDEEEVETDDVLNIFDP